MNPAEVDLRIPRAFVAVAREGSVTRAAQRLHRRRGPGRGWAPLELRWD